MRGSESINKVHLWYFYCISLYFFTVSRQPHNHSQHWRIVGWHRIHNNSELTSVPNTHQLVMAWERRLHSEPAVRVKHFMYTSTHRAPCLFSCIGSDATNITSSSVSGFQSSSTSSRTPLPTASRASSSSSASQTSSQTQTQQTPNPPLNAGNEYVASLTGVRLSLGFYLVSLPLINS